MATLKELALDTALLEYILACDIRSDDTAREMKSNGSDARE